MCVIFTPDGKAAVVSLRYHLDHHLVSGARLRLVDCFYPIEPLAPGLPAGIATLLDSFSLIVLAKHMIVAAGISIIGSTPHRRVSTSSISYAQWHYQSHLSGTCRVLETGRIAHLNVMYLLKSQ
jgi:hypothetical protein